MRIVSRPRALAALALALLFVLSAFAAPPETVLASPGPDQIAGAADGSSSPAERGGDRLSDPGAATQPGLLVLPERAPCDRLPFLAQAGQGSPGHRDRIDRPPRASA
jgi:hypothetical protein